MKINTIAQLPDPQGFSPDPLTELLRSGAQRWIEKAVEAELSVLLEAYASDKPHDGRARLIRHGHLPEREVITGIGPVPVKVPRMRDRRDHVDNSTALPVARQSLLAAMRGCGKPNPLSASALALPLKVFPPVTFTKRSPLCLAHTRQGCLRPRYRGLRPTGGMSMNVGNRAI